MIHPVDITSETLDITTIWCAVTGETGSSATAHLRGGTIAVVAVRRRPDRIPPALMCRNGAAAIMSAAVVDSIEARAKGQVQ